MLLVRIAPTCQGEEILPFQLEILDSLVGLLGSSILSPQRKKDRDHSDSAMIVSKDHFLDLAERMQLSNQRTWLR